MDTTMRLIENSHQGFEGIKAAVCLGSRRVKSNDASGLRRSLRRNGVRNRCQTGLDYFGARYFSAPLGRFMSPDWSETPTPVPYADFSDPQTLNLYTYSRNNPLRYVDSDGHSFWDWVKNTACSAGMESMCTPEQKEEALQRRADSAREFFDNLQNITIGGESPADAIKGLDNNQVIALQRSVVESIRQEVMSQPGMILGLAAVNGAVGGIETAASRIGTSLWPAASGGRSVINGIEYTAHALERMQPVGTIMKGTASFSRGVPPSAVENAIKYGTVTPGNSAAEVVRTFENVRVITNPQGTRVISVIKIGN